MNLNKELLWGLWVSPEYLKTGDLVRPQVLLDPASPMYEEQRVAMMKGLGFGGWGV